MRDKDLLLLGLGAVGVWWAFNKLGQAGALVNPFSDKNIAYQGATGIVKIIGGEKATITDVVPGVNNYDPNKATLSDKPSALPAASAPYWYNADRSKRTIPNGLMATAYDYNGKMIQIDNKTTQAAVFV